MPLLLLLGACSSTAPAPGTLPPVTSQPTAVLTVLPTTPTLEVGQTLALEARSGVVKTSQVTWSAAPESVTTVNPQGVTYAKAPGQALVCAQGSDPASKGCTTVTVIAASAAMPGDPTSFTVTVSTNGGVTLMWSAVSGASDYVLERKSSRTYQSITITKDTIYTDTSTLYSTSYTFRVKARNSAGTSAGLERTVTTLNALAPGGGGTGGSCCKKCVNSKPCGDSCISNNFTCTKPPGCACYGNVPLLPASLNSTCKLEPQIPFYTVDASGKEVLLEAPP